MGLMKPYSDPSGPTAFKTLSHAVKDLTKVFDCFIKELEDLSKAF